MAIDASIFSQFVPKARSVQDYNNEADAAEANRLTLMLQRGQVSDREAARADQQRFMQTMQGIDPAAPVSARATALRSAGFSSQADAMEKSDLDRRNIQSQVDERGAKTAAEGFKLTADKHIAGIKKILSFQKPEDAIASLDLSVSNGEIPAQMAELLKRSVPSNPAEFPAWQNRAAGAIGDVEKTREMLTPFMQTSNTGNAQTTTAYDRFTAKPIAGAGGSVPIMQSPDSIASNARIAAEGAASRAQALTLANRGVVHDTDAGTAVIDPRTGAATLVTNPATGEALGKPLKDIPQAVNKAIIENQQSLGNIDRALTLLSGKNIGDPANGGQTGDAAATGFKGYVPNPLLSRFDAKGVDTRAEIANIGSLIVHDRSGAAVTISEYPRLAPFVPTANDDVDTVNKKLRRLRTELSNESQALADTYSKDQGYKPNPVAGKKAERAATAPAANVVQTPDGQTHTFPTPAAAAAFKKAAGL